MIAQIKKISQEIEEKIFNAELEKMQYDDILTGKLGLAFYSLNKYRALRDVRYLNVIKRILDSIFDSIQNGTCYLATKLTLAEGLPGLGLILDEACKAGLLGDEFNDQISSISYSSFNRCMQMIEDGQFDYFYGAMGILFYLNEVAEYQYCELIIEKLLAHGLANNFYYYNNTHDSYTEGINFGFAHGTPSMVAILFDLHRKGISKDKTEQIIKGSLDALLKFRTENLNYEGLEIIDTMENSFVTQFPYNVILKNKTKTISNTDTDHNNQFHYSGRLGWCNSDLNHVLLLYKIGNYFNNHEYLRIAEDIGLSSVKRISDEDCKATNYFFCHGTSGIAQLYKKIYEESKEKQYEDAYTFWIDKTALYLENSLFLSVANNFDLLTGWLGANLVLQDYLYESQVKGWDKIFLLN